MPRPAKLPYFEEIVTLSLLAVVVYVVLDPSAAYAETPRVLVFLLAAMLPALLVGAHMRAHFKLELPGFLFSTGGAAAVVLGTLLLINWIASPKINMALFHVFTPDREQVSLEGGDQAFEIRGVRGHETPDFYPRGNTVIVIFPDEMPTLTMRVRFAGRYVEGPITYTGSRGTDLIVGTDLK